MKPITKPTTFADLANYVMLRADVSLESRRSIKSNINVFCKIDGIPAQLSPLDVENTRTRMAKANPGAYGITQGNWSKIRSGVWRAYELAGFNVLRGTGLELSGELAELFMPLTRFERAGLTPLIKFLIENGLDISAFGQTHVPIFREWLKAHYTRSNWQRAFKRALDQLTLLQTGYPKAWPPNQVVVEFEKEEWVKPWSEMPRAKSELDLHLAYLRQRKPKRYGGKRRKFSESYLSARTGYVQRLASAAALRLGSDPADFTLEYLTRPDVVQAAVDFYCLRGGFEENGNVAQMVVHALAIARHSVNRVKEDMDALKDILGDVLPPKGAAEKNRKLLEKFRDAALRERFVEFPRRLIEKLLRKKGALTPRDVSDGQLAFLAALLMKVPLRISEVVQLEFGVTLHDHGTGNSRHVAVDIPANQVKNNFERRFIFGSRLIRLFDIYLKHFRCDQTDNKFLFPNKYLEARSGDHLSRKLAALTSREIGVRMTAHQWRHVVGYLFLLENPGEYDSVRQLLGHRSLVTTIRYYAFMLNDDAVDKLDATIDKLMDQAASRYRKGHK